MIVPAISISFIAATLILSYRANQRFREEARLPMQWGLNGAVNWFAPRRVALAVLPALAVVLLGFMTAASMTVAPRPGQEHLVLPVAIAMGATLVAVQLLHFWLIARTIGRRAE